MVIKSWYLAQIRHHQTIKRPICIPSLYHEVKDWLNLTLYWLPKTKFHSDQGCFSPAINTWGTTGCLQLPMAHFLWPCSRMPTNAYERVLNLKKNTLTAGSSSLHEFTHMPFRLSNPGSNFCHFMEMCLDDKQFVTLLL